MSDNKSPKICLVCGDRAIAKNFDVWSCKSCKPFFRRNAFNRNSLICNQSGKCVITVWTRKECRKCRLEKCFSVGMKKEFILNDQERLLRVKVIEENRKKRFMELDVCSVSPASDRSTQSSDLSSIESTTDDNFDVSDIQEFITINEIFNKTITTYKVTLPILRPVYHQDDGLTPLEDMKLSELLQLMSLDELKAMVNDNVIESKNLEEVVQQAGVFYEVEGKRLVTNAKKFTSFSHINENDRLALVKYGGIEIIVLRALIFYDVNNELWKMPILNTDSTYVLRMSMLKLVSYEGYAAYKNNWNIIVKECEFDSVIVDLLTAISLFNPNRPHILDPSTIHNEQRVYMHLLRRYLLFKCRSVSDCDERFARLMQVLVYSNILAQLEKRLFVEYYPHLYGPIARELFDINNKFLTHT